MTSPKTAKSNLHSEILRAAGREELQWLGLSQIGRSRSWLDDHGWWAIIVEFQPSSFAKGSYLNVGASWLWRETEYFSFDVGHRVRDFVKFIDEDQFRAEARKMASTATNEVLRLRSAFPTVNDVARYLKTNAFVGNVWHMLDAGIAAGCIGDGPQSLLCFNRVLERDAKAEFEIRLQETARKLIELLPDTTAFRAQVEAAIQKTRRLRKLAEKVGPLLTVRAGDTLSPLASR